MTRPRPGAGGSGAGRTPVGVGTVCPALVTWVPEPLGVCHGVVRGRGGGGRPGLEPGSVCNTVPKTRGPHGSLRVAGEVSTAGSPSCFLGQGACVAFCLSSFLRQRSLWPVGAPPSSSSPGETGERSLHPLQPRLCSLALGDICGTPFRFLSGEPHEPPLPPWLGCARGPCPGRRVSRPPALCSEASAGCALSSDFLSSETLAEVPKTQELAAAEREGKCFFPGVARQAFASLRLLCHRQEGPGVGTPPRLPAPSCRVLPVTHREPQEERGAGPHLAGEAPPGPGPAISWVSAFCAHSSRIWGGGWPGEQKGSIDWVLAFLPPNSSPPGAS